MNINNYTRLLANPEQITLEDTASLVSIVDRYPFLQSAQALYLKALHNQGSFRYNDALKVAAAHTTNRDVLFDFITSSTFSQNDISKQVQQHNSRINEIEVTIAEDVSQTVKIAESAQLKDELKKAEAILNPSLFEKKVADAKKLIANAEMLQHQTTLKEANEPTTIKPQKSPETPEEVLEINKPLLFKKDDVHSFSQWLQLTKAQPITREEDTITNEPVDDFIDETHKQKFDLIEKFIAERPKIQPAATSGQQKNLAEPYTKPSNSLMTETLAKVYIEQKNYKKAIQAYKILILKNPEKSGFFADQIRAIEKLKDKL